MLFRSLLGVVLGNVLQGIRIGAGYQYAGAGFFEFLNPYALLTGATTLTLFMMHGAIYLLLKTEGRLYQKIRLLLKRGMIFFMVIFGITTLYTLLYIPHLSDAFREQPALFLVPLLTFLSIANVPRLANRKEFRWAFFFSSLTIAMLLVLVAIELYPVLLRSTVDPAYNITVYNAASSTGSLKIMLTIVAIGAPLVLGYTIFVYRTFRGKVRLDETSY